MNTWRWILLLLLVTPAVASAQMGPPDRGSPEEQQRRAQWRERYMKWRQEQESVWQEASEFARQHSPNRWMLYEQLPDTAPAKERIRGAIVGRYMILKRVGNPGESAYNLALERVKAEDDAWALGRQIRIAGTDSERETLRGQLRELVVKMVERHLEERQTRINRLKTAVSQEEKRLAEDQNRREELVSKQMEQIIEDEEHLLRPPPGGPHGGPPGGPGGRDRRGPDGMGRGPEGGPPPGDGPSPGDDAPDAGPRSGEHRPRSREGDDRPRPQDHPPGRGPQSPPRADEPQNP